MTRDEIVEMAREAGFRAGYIKLGNSDPLPFVAPCSAMDCLPELVRFAALVAAAEREACAELCDAHWMASSFDAETAKSCAAVIRARPSQ